MLSEFLAALKLRDADFETVAVDRLITDFRGELQEISRKYYHVVELEKIVLRLWNLMTEEQRMAIPLGMFSYIRKLKEETDGSDQTSV